MQDKAGNWSNDRATTITIRGGASAGTAAALLGFGYNVGGVTVSPQAGIPAVFGNQGMLATVPAATHAPAYVGTDSVDDSAVVPGGVRDEPQHVAWRTERDDHTVRRPYRKRNRERGLRDPDADHVQRRRHRTDPCGADTHQRHDRGGNWVNFTTGAKLVTVQWTNGPATGAAAGRSGSP